VFDQASGWIYGRNLEHLLWLPQNYRTNGLMWLSSHQHAFGEAEIWIDWNEYVHGSEWMKCYVESEI
jgi:hypothetical protein